MFRPFTRQSLLEVERLQEERKRAAAAGGPLEDEPAAANADLEAGKSLPLIYGEPAAELLNTPLEDLDSFYLHTRKVGAAAVPPPRRRRPAASPLSSPSRRSS